MKERAAAGLRLTFREELESIINRHCMGSESTTPDFILADYLMACLAAWENGTRERDLGRRQVNIP